MIAQMLCISRLYNEKQMNGKREDCELKKCSWDNLMTKLNKPTV